MSSATKSVVELFFYFSLMPCGRIAVHYIRKRVIIMKRFVNLISLAFLSWGLLYVPDSQASVTSPLDGVNAFSTATDDITDLPDSPQAQRAAAKQLTIPSSSPIPLEGYRWPSRQITVYMATQDHQVQVAFRVAVKKWNQTKAVHLHWIKSRQRAEVIVTDGDLQTTGNSNVGYVTSQLGSTETQFNPDTHAMIRAKSTLDAAKLRYVNRQYRDHVAEHELGHALGLAHAPEDYQSVMIPRNIRRGISKLDRQALRNLYGLN